MNWPVIWSLRNTLTNNKTEFRKSELRKNKKTKFIKLKQLKWIQKGSGKEFIMKKNTLFASLLAAAVLAGCSSQNSDNTGPADSSSNSTENQTIKIGLTGAVYEDLWAPAKEKLANEGIDLEYVQFSDFATPNNALNSGDIDLNAFQHEIYLDSEKESQGYEIEPVGYTFIIPLNLYSSKYKTLDELPDGAVIAIPDDLTNGGRALKVLDEAGLIELKDGSDFSPTVKDIKSSDKNIQIKELKANTIPSALADVDAALITGNFALDFGLKTDEAIYQDSALDQKEYWNLIAARSEDLKDPKKKEVYETVVESFQQPETEGVFNNQYGGYFIPEGWNN